MPPEGDSPVFPISTRSATTAGIIVPDRGTPIDALLPAERQDALEAVSAFLLTPKADRPSWRYLRDEVLATAFPEQATALQAWPEEKLAKWAVDVVGPAVVITGAWMKKAVLKGGRDLNLFDTQLRLAEQIEGRVTATFQRANDLDAEAAQLRAAAESEPDPKERGKLLGRARERANEATAATALAGKLAAQASAIYAEAASFGERIGAYPPKKTDIRKFDLRANVDLTAAARRFEKS